LGVSSLENVDPHLKESHLPIKLVKKFMSWSYSRYHDYAGCPLFAQLKYLLKVDDGSSNSKPLLHGSKVHEEADQYLISKKTKLTENLARFPDEFADLRTRKGLVTGRAASLAVDKYWKPCRDDDWDHAWLRAKFDAAYLDDGRLVVIDFKTGRIRPEQVDQLEIYACVGLAHHPEVSAVEAHFWYLEQGEIVSRIYGAGEIPALRLAWEKRAGKMLGDGTFKPAPGDKCRWCNYGAGKLGRCKF
jgi:hypothetical protein